MDLAPRNSSISILGKCGYAISTLLWSVALPGQTVSRRFPASCSPAEPSEWNELFFQ